jgi:hypothetical protein
MLYYMTHTTILLKSETCAMMKHMARKEQTYDDFILELLDIRKKLPMVLDCYLLDAGGVGAQYNKK